MTPTSLFPEGAAPVAILEGGCLAHLAEMKPEALDAAELSAAPAAPAADALPGQPSLFE